jgi:signal transduction histidine kinase
LRGTARFAANHLRATVVISLVLICGSFAAAAALSMRFDRVHALDQALVFEQRRAGDVAAVIGAGLDAKEKLGRAFADGELGSIPPDGVRNIAVYAPDGTPLNLMTGTSAFVHLPRDVIGGARTHRMLIADGELATIISPYGSYVVAVAFDARTLAPASMLQRVSVATASGMRLSGTADGGRVQARAADWPVTVSITPDDDGALSAWYGSLPLYLFVILGPALAGAWLAALFVGEFERRARAEAFKSRPADARLLVRLAQSERDAIEAQRSKAEFIAHMSHELRTPLNAVIGFSEVIEQGMFGPAGHPKYVEYARDIASAGRGLHAKIGDILEYANLEAGRYPIALARFDAAALAASCVEEQTGRAFSRRVSLELIPSEPLFVHADLKAVRRVLTAVIANALAYTPEGGRVRVEAFLEEGAVAVAVSDTGPGFRPEEKASAGNAFRRFDRKGAETGAGLGLAIAVALARRTGGALTLTSLPARGTRTELRLPRAMN